MLRRWATGCAIVFVAVVLCGTTSDGQTGSTPKACAVFPVAELEALFATKATPLKGSDMSTVSTCGANFPDVRHTASVNMRPPSPADQAMGIEQRLAMTKDAMGKGRFESQAFGDIGCFRTDQPLGSGKPLPSATCFQVASGYIALAIGSDDPKQVSFDVVMDLLKKTVAMRK